MSGTAGKRSKRTDATARKARALPLLIQGLPYAEIAATLAVSTKTIERWVAKDSMIKRALADVSKNHEAVVEEARKELRGGMSAAIRTLIAAAERGDTRAASRLLDLLGVGMPRKFEHDAAPGMTNVLAEVARILAEKRARRRDSERVEDDEARGAKEESDGSDEHEG